MQPEEKAISYIPSKSIRDILINARDGRNSPLLCIEQAREQVEQPVQREGFITICLGISFTL